MGRQQFFKGNPELKQYFLVNDFSGGINTTDVDERTSDSEFRELLNVELIRAGMIQNRKGWGYATLLNLLLERKNITLPTYQLNGTTVPVEQYALMKIVKNVGNVLPLIEESEQKNTSIDEFLAYNYTYELEILMIYSDNISIKLGLLKLSSSNAQGANGFQVIANLAQNTELADERPLTNIETIAYADKIYFSLSQLKPLLPGFGEYDIDNKIFRFVRDNERPTGTVNEPAAFIYKPNPYEATKIGFNVLSQTPLTDVTTVSTLFSITGVFLTSYEVNPTTNVLTDTQTPIQTIPLDGKFTVNVLYSGQAVSINDFTINFFSFSNDINGIPQEDDISYTVKAVKQENNIGVLRFAVEVDIKSKNYRDINMRIIGRNGILFSQTYLRSFTDTDAMVAFFNPATDTKYVTFANGRYTLFTKTATPFNYNSLTELTYQTKTFPITDDNNFGTGSVKLWETSTAQAYNEQIGNKGVHRPAGECDQTIFDAINTTSLNTTGSFLPTTQYTTGYIAEIRKSRTQTTTLADTFSWTGTTSTNFSSTQEVTSSQFDSFTTSSLPSLPSSSFPAGHIRRIIAYTTIQTPIYQTQTTAGSWSRTYILNQSQVIGSNDIEYPDPGPFSAVQNRLTDSQIAAQIASSFGTSGTEGSLVTVEEYYIRDFDGVKMTLDNKTFRLSGGTTTQTIVGYNTETVVYGVRYYIVNFQAGTTSSTRVDCSPAEIKYFKLIEQPLGEAITYNTNDKKIYYRLNNAKTNLFQPNEEITLIPTLTVIKPNFGSRYLIGTNPADQTKYYLYNGGLTNDLTSFTNITFADSVTEVEYLDNYIVSDPTLRKIEPLDVKGFRLIEASNRLIIYKENIIWFSDLYQFDYIPNYNYVVLPLNPNDKIMSINYFKGSYIIFTKERIYKMSGTFGNPDFQIQIVNDSIGCISAFSVKGFNNTLVFMTHDGLYRLKQNYYSGGLENVEKIDKQIDGIIPFNTEVYSLLYNEQYILIYDYAEGIPDSGFNALKLYYNMSAPNGFPYVKDNYSIMPNVIGQFDDGLYSIKYGKVYKYDKGYTDFLPPNETITTTDTNHPSLYTVRIRTHKIAFGYPTHEKKFKAILIKDIANEPVPLLFDIYINNDRAYRHTQFEVTLSDSGEIVYQPVVTNPVVIGADNLLGNFELNRAQLGDLSARVHKIVFSAKGKDILLDIERRTAQQFSIQDIGYVYKMGKAREDR